MRLSIVAVPWHGGRIARSLALLALLFPLIAVEPVVDPAKPPLTGTAEPTSPVVPALIVIEAKKGGVATLNPQAPTKMLGGVRIGYGAAFVLCDHLHLWQSKLSGLKRATLDHALIASGPDAEEPEHVVLNTRASTDPLIKFRGDMRPREVEIIRQPLTEVDLLVLERREAASKDQPAGQLPVASTDAQTERVSVRFRVLLHSVNDFDGYLLVRDGWAQHVGWADEIEMQVCADLPPDGKNLVNLRVTVIDMFGRAAAPGQSKRPARLQRRGVPVSDPSAVKPTDIQETEWWIESSRITITFEETGGIKELLTDTDSVIGGTPSLDSPISKRETTTAPKSLTSPIKP